MIVGLARLPPPVLRVRNTVSNSWLIVYRELSANRLLLIIPTMVSESLSNAKEAPACRSLFQIIAIALAIGVVMVAPVAAVALLIPGLTTCLYLVFFLLVLLVHVVRAGRRDGPDGADLAFALDEAVARHGSGADGDLFP